MEVWKSIVSSHVTVCDFLGFVKSFFSETPIDEENHFVLKGDRITRLDLLVDWPEKYFSGQSSGRISTLPELGW